MLTNILLLHRYLRDGIRTSCTKRSVKIYTTQFLHRTNC